MNKIHKVRRKRAGQPHCRPSSNNRNLNTLNHITSSQQISQGSESNPYRWRSSHINADCASASRTSNGDSREHCRGVEPIEQWSSEAPLSGPIMLFSGEDTSSTPRIVQHSTPIFTSQKCDRPLLQNHLCHFRIRHDNAVPWPKPNFKWLVMEPFREVLY